MDQLLCRRQPLLQEPGGGVGIAFPQRNVAEIPRRRCDTPLVSGLAGELQAFLVHGTGGSVVAFGSGHFAQKIQRYRDTALVPDLPPQREAVDVKLLCPIKLALIESDAPQQVQGAAHSRRVAEVSKYCQAFRAECGRGPVVSLPPGEKPRLAQDLCPESVSGGVPAKHGFEPHATLAEV